MCGICGASLSRTDATDLHAVARQLLLGIEERGRHATGLAWERDGDIWIDKAPVTASKFVSDMPDLAETKAFLGHTRWASQGSPSNPLNNHPIEAGGLVGIHNGVLHNDDALFDLLPRGVRRGEVDSEAIFAFVALSGLPVGEALSWMTGSAAVAWLAEDDTTTLHLARISRSPLVLGRSTTGSLYFASTESCLAKLVKVGVRLESCREVEEGSYLTIQYGEVTSFQRFAVSGSGVLSAVERRALNLEPQH